METDEFKQWLAEIADAIADGTGSIALCACTDENADNVTIAAAGPLASEAMATLLATAVVAAQQTRPEGVTLN